MPESERRLFVDFEGIDGSGKTTLSNRVADLLREQGYTVHHIRDKGVFRSEISKKIRKMGRDPHNVRMSDTAEMLLYTAREAQMVEEYVKPRWQDGAIIFSDRYLYSVVAHSCFGRGLDRGIAAVTIGAAQHHGGAGVHRLVIGSRVARDAARVLLIDVGPVLGQRVAGLPLGRGRGAGVLHVLRRLSTRGHERGGQQNRREDQDEPAEAAGMQGSGHQKANVALARTE